MSLVQRMQERIAAGPVLVLIVGDAMTDVWVHGRVEGCQDGCPKFVEEGRVRTPGGAANAQATIQHWGARVQLYCAEVGYQCSKMRLIDQHGNIVFRIDDDRTAGLSRWERAQMMGTIPYAGAVLLSDYDKGVLAPDLIREVVAACNSGPRRNVPCVADAKRAPELYEGCILKGNADWAHRSKVNLLTDGLVVTFGARNPTVSGRTLPQPDGDVPCVNHVGAGDCFAAHLALGLACGLGMEDAAAVAHSAGRVYVQFPHNRAPHPAEVAADMADVPAPVRA